MKFISSKMESERTRNLDLIQDLIEKDLEVLNQMKINNEIMRICIENLLAVLCDPEGTVVINGSDGDREVIQESLDKLKAL